MVLGGDASMTQSLEYQNQSLVGKLYGHTMVEQYFIVWMDKKWLLVLGYTS
jgi:hypothetical protein